MQMHILFFCAQPHAGETRSKAAHGTCGGRGRFSPARSKLYKLSEIIEIYIKIEIIS